MASIEYPIQGNHTTGYVTTHYHYGAIGTMNEWARDNLPYNAKVSSVQVHFRGKLSVGDTNVYVGYTHDASAKPAEMLTSGQLKTSPQTFIGYFSSFQADYPFNILPPGYMMVGVWADSGIIVKKYTCEYFKVIWYYDIPSYTVAVTAGTGGTASGGGTFVNRTITTITATPNKGYKFKQWNDGNTDNPRSIDVTGDTVYTAEFTLKEYPITVECEPSVSGEVCTFSGAGTYKYGDTITITATNIPPRHQVDAWFCNTQYLKDVGRGKTQFSVVLTEEALTGFSEATTQQIEFKCWLVHTGYKICANIYPDTTAGYVSYVHYENGTYYHLDEVTADGVTMYPNERGIAGLVAYPLNHYEFIKWSDGNTDNPRILPLTDDATYTAVFGVDLLFIGNQLPKAIYVGTQEVKEVFIGTERVYLKSDY